VGPVFSPSALGSNGIPASWPTAPLHI